MTMMKPMSFLEMLDQSRDIMLNPSVATFERHEQRGTLTNAAIYVGVAALISALIGAISGGPAGFLSSLLASLAQFFVFTGMVYLLGKSMFGGTGNWDEVAYTFSLFTAPLILLGALVGLIIVLFSWIPVLNLLVGLAGLVVALLMLAVQTTTLTSPYSRA
jgi:FtsH-binding integral membrane protein